MIGDLLAFLNLDDISLGEAVGIGFCLGVLALLGWYMDQVDRDRKGGGRR